MNRITCEIGIDMAHRVPQHESKCRNLHGHRYRIIATVEGDLHDEGAQDGMVLDFGFLKKLMLDTIDLPCDHGTALWVNDSLLAYELGPSYQSVQALVAQYGNYGMFDGWKWGKLMVMRDVPTAENLAKLWFHLLQPNVDKYLATLQGGLHSVTVWETPNFSASYDRTMKKTLWNTEFTHKVVTEK